MTLVVDSELASLVGPSHVLTDPSAFTDLGVDGNLPEHIVAPAQTEQVAGVLHYAAEHGMAVIASGHGTKLSTGNPPQRYDIALSLRELNRVIQFEPADLTITVEAGATLGEFQALIGRHGLWLPIDPRGGAESTIGGIIAANAAGPLRQAFGGPRDMVLGLKMASTDGKIAKTGGRVVKNVAGYDFGKLLTGSFGTLGVIVEASLKLFPKPPERATFAMQAGTLGIARDLRRSILRSPIDPLRLVLLDSSATGLLDGPEVTGPKVGSVLWTEVGGSNRVIERCASELQQLASGVGATFTRREDAEAAWKQIADPAQWLHAKYRDMTILKAALPLAASEEFLSRAQQEAVADKLGLACIAQVGVGIVHLCALQETLSSNVAGWVARLRQAAVDLRGNLMIEHCPTSLKSGVDVWGARGDDLDAMRKLKSVWDPHQVLAPGRFLGF